MLYNARAHTVLEAVYKSCANCGITLCFLCQKEGYDCIRRFGSCIYLRKF